MPTAAVVTKKRAPLARVSSYLLLSDVITHTSTMLSSTKHTPRIIGVPHEPRKFLMSSNISEPDCGTIHIHAPYGITAEHAKPANTSMASTIPRRLLSFSDFSITVTVLLSLTKLQNFFALSYSVSFFYFGVSFNLEINDDKNQNNCYFCHIE